MSQNGMIKKVNQESKSYKTDYFLLLLNQNQELAIDNRKYWIGNGLMTTEGLLALYNIEQDKRHR
jgi:hypothetical protein